MSFARRNLPRGVTQSGSYGEWIGIWKKMVTIPEFERIVLLGFIHRLVSQEQTKSRKLKIIDKISQYTRPQKITQGAITNHRATYLGAHTHKPLKQVRHRWQ
jgi:hypothetical protein